MNKKTALIFSGKSATAVPGGLGAYAYNSCRVFYELGYDVHLFGYGRLTNTTSFLYGTQHTVHTRLGGLSSLAAPLINRTLARAATKVMLGTETTHVVAFGAGIWAGAGNLLKKSFSTFPISLRVLGTYFTTFVHEYGGQVRGASIEDYGIYANSLVKLGYLGAIGLSFYEHRTLKNLDDIIVHYDSSKKILTEEFKDLDQTRITKIHYFNDLYNRLGNHSSTSSNSSTMLISIICRQDPRKGINTFLHAVKLLAVKTKNFRVVIAGSGVFLSRHIKLANKLGLSNYIEFAGFIRSAEYLILSSDIIVLPSFEEGAGAISLLEAMKVGRAIISSNCDGIPEDLDHEQSALLFEPGNSKDLATQMGRLISNPSLRDQLATNAQKRYNEKFSFNQMKTGFEQLLSKHSL